MALNAYNINGAPNIFDRMFTIMVGVSAAAHVLLFSGFLVLPQLFAKPIQADENVIKIEMLVNDLPKGPNIGTRAPRKDVTAARAPDHRKLKDIVKKEERSPMAPKQKTPQIKSNRINYKERKRQKAISNAIDRVKAMKDAKAGGGGTRDRDGGNVFSLYLARVQSRLQNAWALPPNLSAEDRTKRVRLRIKIGANGSITSSYVAGSSGLPHLDQSAKAAVSAVGSVPPPPPLIAKELASKGMLVTFDPRTK